MDYRDRQERDKVVDQYLKEKIDFGIPFVVFVIATILGMLGILLYYVLWLFKKIMLYYKRI